MKRNPIFTALSFLAILFLGSCANRTPSIDVLSIDGKPITSEQWSFPAGAELAIEYEAISEKSPLTLITVLAKQGTTNTPIHQLTRENEHSIKHTFPLRLIDAHTLDQTHIDSLIQHVPNINEATGLLGIDDLASGKTYQIVLQARNESGKVSEETFTLTIE
ncbi:hypothetical protein [Pontibacter sp. G13]|uniref:hypothetical protein n=1 Tax=Pontibacter sp. G13 TaxID=3074898 RepID=UPI00288C6056|nr:hypothetical protein [Pontibacter sp. G13]WNJ17174.1 hypothetical protein RJD25_20145 [Pontibacter sp. G13]